MPSQTFIRREIAALEARGCTVHRFALRRFDGELAEAADRAEQERTEYLLDVGAAGLAMALLGRGAGPAAPWLAALSAAVPDGPALGERACSRHLIYLAEACPAPPPAGRVAAPAPSRPLRHQRRGRRDALPPARRPALQLHDPRARGIRRARAAGPAREDPSRRLRRRHQPLHPQPALPVVRDRGLAQDPRGPLRPGRGLPGDGRRRPSRIGRGWSPWGGWPSRRASSCWSRRRPAAGPGLGLRAGHRGRRPDARRARAGHRPVRPAGPRADHRLPGQPGGPPRAGSRAGPGPAQLRRGAARW